MSTKTYGWPRTVGHTWVPSTQEAVARGCPFQDHAQATQLDHFSKTKGSMLWGCFQLLTQTVKVRQNGRTQEIGIILLFTVCPQCPGSTTKISPSSQEAQGLLAAEPKHQFQLSELTLISILRGPSGTCTKWTPCTWWAKFIDGPCYILSRKKILRTSSHRVKFSRAYLLAMASPFCTPPPFCLNKDSSWNESNLVLITTVTHFSRFLPVVPSQLIQTLTSSTYYELPINNIAKNLLRFSETYKKRARLGHMVLNSPQRPPHLCLWYW